MQMDVAKNSEVANSHLHLFTLKATATMQLQLLQSRFTHQHRDSELI